MFASDFFKGAGSAIATGASALVTWSTAHTVAAGLIVAFVVGVVVGKFWL